MNDTSANPTVLIETTMGNITIELDMQNAPNTSENFLAYVDDGYYVDTTFHRVIPNFMIQGGDPEGNGRGGPGYSIPDEFHPELRHQGGGIMSMANRGPDTGGSQFFLTEKSTPHLNNRHAVFGRCNDVEVIKKIARVPVGAGNRPITPVTIKTLTIEWGTFKPAP